MSETGDTFLDFSPLGEARKAQAYIEAAWTLFRENRAPKYPYIKDLSLESGPLLFLCGHATELACKATLRSRGADPDRLRKFRGFAYCPGGRKSNSSFRRHDLAFLFRAVSLLILDSDDRKKLDAQLRNHKYHNEHFEIFLTPPDRPSLTTYAEQLRHLNSGFDRPYSYRYFSQGIATLPDPEIILVVASFLAQLAAPATTAQH